MKIWELLDSPEKWTTKTCARDKNGKQVSSNDSSAVSWCLLGAVDKCYSEEHRGVVRKIRNKLGINLIGEWNDEQTFENVLKLAKELDI